MLSFNYPNDFNSSKSPAFYLDIDSHKDTKAASFFEPLRLRGQPKKIAAKPLCVENAQHFLLLT
jgi:hypothetical protein